MIAMELAETQMTRNGVTKSRYWKDGWMVNKAKWLELTGGRDMNAEPHVVTPTKSGGIRKCWMISTEGQVVDQNAPPERIATFTQTFHPRWSRGERYVGIALHQLEKIAPMKDWDEVFGEGILVGYKKAWVPKGPWERAASQLKNRFGRTLWPFERFHFHKERTPRYDISANCKTPAEFMAG